MLSLALFTSPTVLPVEGFLAAVALHILSGLALHAFQLHDFQVALVGKFVETDMATKKGVTILVTFVLTVSTLALPTSLAGARLAYGPAWLALVAACGANVLPILQDTVYNFVQLITGTRPGATPPVTPPVKFTGDYSSGSGTYTLPDNLPDVHDLRA